MWHREVKYIKSARRYMQVSTHKNKILIDSCTIHLTRITKLPRRPPLQFFSLSLSLSPFCESGQVGKVLMGNRIDGGGRPRRPNEHCPSLPPPFATSHGRPTFVTAIVAAFRFASKSYCVTMPHESLTVSQPTYELSQTLIQVN